MVPSLVSNSFLAGTHWSLHNCVFKGEPLQLFRFSASGVFPSGLYPEIFKCLGLPGLPALSPPLLESPGIHLVSHFFSCGWKLGINWMTLQDSCDLELLCLSAAFYIPWPSCFPISWFTPLLAKIYLSSNSFIRMDVWEIKMFNPFWSENNLGLHLGLTERYLAVQLLSHVWLFGTPWTAARQASLSFTISWSLLKLMSTESVMPSNHLILCHPLLFLPSIFPSIRVFSSESALHIRWPKYWSFSFSISPSNEYSGLISFRIDY